MIKSASARGRPGALFKCLENRIIPPEDDNPKFDASQ